VDVNGEPGALLMLGDSPSSVISLELDESGFVVRIFLIGNPDKLPETHNGRR
jgi:hypothetical protein